MTEAERRQVFRKVVETTGSKFADPKLNGIDFRALAEQHEPAIIRAPSADDFEARLNELLQKLASFCRETA